MFFVKVVLGGGEGEASFLLLITDVEFKSIETVFGDLCLHFIVMALSFPEIEAEGFFTLFFCLGKG